MDHLVRSNHRSQSLLQTKLTSLPIEQGRLGWHARSDRMVGSQVHRQAPEGRDGLCFGRHRPRRPGHDRARARRRLQGHRVGRLGGEGQVPP